MEVEDYGFDQVDLDLGKNPFGRVDARIFGGDGSSLFAEQRYGDGVKKNLGILNRLFEETGNSSTVVETTALVVRGDFERVIAEVDGFFPQHVDAGAEDFVSNEPFEPLLVLGNGSELLVPSESFLAYQQMTKSDQSSTDLASNKISDAELIEPLAVSEGGKSEGSLFSRVTGKFSSLFMNAKQRLGTIADKVAAFFGTPATGA